MGEIMSMRVNLVKTARDRRWAFRVTEVTRAGLLSGGAFYRSW